MFLRLEFLKVNDLDPDLVLVSHNVWPRFRSQFWSLSLGQANSPQYAKPADGPLFYPNILHSNKFLSLVSYLRSKTEKVSYISAMEITNADAIEINANFNSEKKSQVMIWLFSF